MTQSKYLQLSEKLIETINNELEVGDSLPSERKLAEKYQVSRTTVRLALDDLESRGYISTQHGKGSFVVDYHKTLINLSDMYSFTEQMKAIGQTPKTKLLSDSVIDTNDNRITEQFFFGYLTNFFHLFRESVQTDQKSKRFMYIHV